MLDLVPFTLKISAKVTLKENWKYDFNTKLKTLWEKERFEQYPFLTVSAEVVFIRERANHTKTWPYLLQCIS